MLTGGDRASSAASSRAATTSSRRSSRATTGCGSSRRRSSARSLASPSSRTTPTRSRSPTTRCTGWAPACGPGTCNTAYRMGRGHPGRPGVDQLLPRLPGARGVRRLQAVGHRPREPQDDARPLPADQEPAGQLQPRQAGLLLTMSPARRRSATDAAASRAATELVAAARPAAVPPVRRLLRRQLADVLPAGRVPRRERRRAPGRARAARRST